MENEYKSPEITTLSSENEFNGDATVMGNWAWTETVAVAYAYALALVVVTQIDVTP